MEKKKKDLTKMGLNPKFYGNLKDFHQEQMENDPTYRKEYGRLELQKKVACQDTGIEDLSENHDHFPWQGAYLRV